MEVFCSFGLALWACSFPQRCLFPSLGYRHSDEDPQNLVISGIDYSLRRKVFGLFRVYFVCIHSIMGHCACSVFATPSVTVLRLN